MAIGTKGQVIVVGSFRFPSGDAACNRVLGIGKALRELSYEVVFLGLPSPSHPTDDHAGPHHFQGFEYWVYDDAGRPERGDSPRLARYLRSGKKSLARLQCFDLKALQAVIFYGGTTPFLLKLWRFGRSTGIRLISDCCEWHSASHGRGGKLGVVHIDDFLCMRVVRPMFRNIIGISGLLARYYEEKGCHTILVPPMIDSADQEWHRQDFYGASHNGPLRLAFVGSPHRERWDLVLEGMDLLASRGLMARIHLFGGMEADVVEALGSLADRWPRWRRYFEFKGRLERADLLAALTDCDVAFLLRDDAHWSRACFPSKVPELLRSGLPLIYNDTSDLCQYLRDGREGILVEALTSESFARAVERLAEMPSESRVSMCENAIRLARDIFDYRHWVEPLGVFMRALR